MSSFVIFVRLFFDEVVMCTGKSLKAMFCFITELGRVGVYPSLLSFIDFYIVSYPM